VNKPTIATIKTAADARTITRGIVDMDRLSIEFGLLNISVTEL
jgi:hypothetical protein